MFQDITFISPPDLRSKRQLWATTRSILEANNFKHKRNGKKSKRNWDSFKQILNAMTLGVRALGLYSKGFKNCHNIQLNKFNLTFNNLPSNFDGLRILQLSDLHIDATEFLQEAIINSISNVDFDVALLTGDYRKDTSGCFRQILPMLKNVSSTLQKEFPPIAILGNHDTYLLSEYESELNIKFLINESLKLRRGDQSIIVSGADDPFYYYTDAALQTFVEDKAFKIAMVHSSELYDIAENYNYSLYLCGHTHGGQICLPGGKPIITHQKEGGDFVSGLWNHENLTGYTSRGCGVSGVPLRFNCKPEITLFTLKSGVNNSV